MADRMIRGYDPAGHGYGRLLWPAVMVLMSIIGVQLLDGTLTYIRGSDGLSYVLLAKAIATGQGFSDINIPGAPPHTQYPPVLPLVLAPVYYLFGYNFFVMKAVMLAIGLGALVMTKRLLQDTAGSAVAISIALLVGTNYYFISLERELLTEVPYVLLTILAILSFVRYRREGPFGRYCIILPVVLAVACLTRMIGVTLYAAMALALLLGVYRSVEGRVQAAKKLAFFVAAGGLPFAAWALRNSLNSTGASTYQAIFMRSDYYAQDLGGLALSALAGRFVKNVGYYIDAVPKAVLTSGGFKDSLPPLVLEAVMIVLLAVVLVGFFYELWRRRGGVVELYIILYFSLLTVWPVYGSGDARRYVVPMLPFVYYYLFTGIKVVFGPLQALKSPAPPGLTKVYAAALAVLLVMNLVQIKELVNPVSAAGRVYALAAGLPESFGDKGTDLTHEAAAVEYFSENVPCYSSYMLAAFALRQGMGQSDVVMVRKAELAALITGGYAVRFPYTSDPVAMSSFMAANSVDYVILDTCYGEAEQYLLPFVNANRESFEVVWNDADVTLLLRYKGRVRP